MENLLPIIGRILMSFLMAYAGATLVLTIALRDVLRSLPKTYAAIRDGRYVFQENFQGTMYFMKKDSPFRWWEKWGRPDTIIIFKEGSVKLLGYDVYLHSWFLSFFHPYMLYWKIRFSRLIKHNKDAWNKI